MASWAGLFCSFQFGITEADSLVSADLNPPAGFGCEVESAFVVVAGGSRVVILGILLLVVESLLTFHDHRARVLLFLEFGL